MSVNTCIPPDHVLELLILPVGYYIKRNPQRDQTERVRPDANTADLG